jgi:hypothetical protein
LEGGSGLPASTSDSLPLWPTEAWSGFAKPFSSREDSSFPARYGLTAGWHDPLPLSQMSLFAQFLSSLWRTLSPGDRNRSLPPFFGKRIQSRQHTIHLKNGKYVARFHI